MSYSTHKLSDVARVSEKHRVSGRRSNAEIYTLWLWTRIISIKQ